VEKVRIGVIGCGGFMRYRLRKLLEVPEAEVAALADTNPEQIQATWSAYPQFSSLPSFADYKKMLDEDKLDAVMIATPHTLHCEQILAALEHGLHVIVEKPMVTSVADAHRVIAARDKAGKQAMVSYQRHLQPEFGYIRDRIASGEFGEVRVVQALLSQEWKRFTIGSWRQDPALSGGGQLNDSGSHMLDILLWVTGLKAETVTAFCDNRGTQVDIDTAMSVKFVGGALGSITIAGDAHNWHEDITIWCAKGTFYLRQGKLTIVDEPGNRFVVENFAGGSHPDRNFIDAILGRDQVISPFECGLRVMELTEAAWQSSAAGGKPISVA
jgi:predicted dehydrogenase